VNTGIGSFHKIQVSVQVLDLADMEELCRIARGHGLPDKSRVTFGLEHDATIHAEILTSDPLPMPDPWQEATP
jgi:hypothetical protein